MYIYANGNEYKGAVQFINGVPYDAAGQQLVYTETASPNSGLKAGDESGRMQEAGEAEQTDRTESEMFGLDLSPNLRDEGTGFFKTLFTAGSNLSTDALQELDYIAQAVSNPIDTGEAVLRVLAGYAQKALPNDWEAYLPEDWATNKMYANAINDYYAEKYGSLEQALDSFAEQPVSVALDALAIKALMSTVSKQATKKAAVTSEMAKTAKGTVMEGELAARAAAELKVAEELNRTVKYEGKLVWDDALGAYVPESSVTKPAKIDAAEVAPLIKEIEAATPSVQPAVANLNTEGMMRATRNQEAFPGELAQAKLAADPDLPYGEGTTINTATPSTSTARANQIVDEINILDSIEGDRGLSASEAAKYESLWKELELQTNTTPVAAKAGEIVNPGKASIDKLTRDKQRMADDDIMAAATQADLFENGSAAAYEAMIASQLANRAAQTSAVATTVPKGMMTSKVSGPISRTKDIDIPVVAPRTLTSKPVGPISRTKDIDIPPPRMTPKPESASRGFKKAEISAALPAAQRVAAAASQTGLQGIRGEDGSFLPELPDRGIDIDQSIGASVPEPVEIIKSSEKPGWFQGVTKEDDDDGNYWSADFEDEHWNTPAGVQEAIGIWGRPVGNRIGQRFN
jgi:hypothetical protein